MISDKTIGRLSLYRRILDELRMEGVQNIYSHQLASMTGGTAAQVRRDLMVTGYSGSPTHGYGVQDLIESIGKFLDDPNGQAVALFGIGNLGRAILHYFAGRRPKLSIVAAFDSDPTKVHRVIHGCRCYPMEDLDDVIREHDIQLGLITVPAAEAQGIADRLVRAGVRGLINFAPVHLHVPPNIYVESIDITMSLEKVAYFARQGTTERK